MVVDEVEAAVAVECVSVCVLVREACSPSVDFGGTCEVYLLT